MSCNFPPRFDQDGRVSIRESDTGLFVSPALKAAGPGAAAAVGHSPAAMQFVVSIDMKDWDALKCHAKPESCLMPHRDSYKGRARITMQPEDQDAAAAAAGAAGPSAKAEAAKEAGQGGQNATGRKRPLDVDMDGTDTSPPEQVKGMDACVRRGVGSVCKVLASASPRKKIAV